MKRIAIPVNNGRLSEYFGKCSYYKIYDIKGSSIQEKKFELPAIHSIDELPGWASKKGITDILTYKIDKRIIMLFNKYKINLFIGIPVDRPENLIYEFLRERITSNSKIIAEIMDGE